MTLEQLLFATRAQLGDTSGEDLFFTQEELTAWLNEALRDVAWRLGLSDSDDVPPALVDPADVPELPPVYHRFLPVFAASRGKTKEGDDVAAAGRMREYLALIREARTRAVLNQSEPLEIQDGP